MGRLSDALSAIYLGYATLHHFQRNRNSVVGLNALAESALLQLEYEAQTALQQASLNFPQPLGIVGGMLMGMGVSPLGGLARPYRLPSDALTKEVAHMLSTPSDVHNMFAECVYTDECGVTENRVAGLLRAMPVCVAADQVLAAMKKERRQPTSDEAKLLNEAEQMRDKLVQVDVHETVGPLEQQAGYVRPALLSTERRRLKAGLDCFEGTCHDADAVHKSSLRSNAC